MDRTDQADFLRRTPPFDALPREAFEKATRSLDSVTHTAGSWIARAGGEPMRHLFVIRKGAVRLERDGHTLQVLEEGEAFGYTSLISGEATLDVAVEHDLVAYRIPSADFLELLGDARFARHFAVGLSERLRASFDASPVATFPPDMTQEVRHLSRRGAIWVEAGATVQEAAQLMRREHISSVLVRTDPPGIVTDRDFRNRLLAEGLGPTEPVTRIFTQPLITVSEAMPVYQAWEFLLEAGVHHLPLVKGAEITGVITSTDLLRSTSQGPIGILRRVERLATREGLPGYAAKVTEMVAALLSGQLDALVIAGFVARLNDALLRRVLEWAHADLGPAPAPYSWIVFGSEGRMEQTLLTDQDNALVFADAGEAQREWFQRFATRVNDDLVTAGFPPCPGGYMAKNWLGTLTEWTDRFCKWIDEPRPQALLESAIFFDFRGVAGELDLSPMQSQIAAAPDKPAFLRFLARTALSQRPPPPLLMRLRGSSSTIDLKKHGIAPIVSLARCYAMEAGSDRRNTMERLDAALRSGLMGDDVWLSVTEAYRFLVALRLRLQLRDLSGGKGTTNEVAMSGLNPVERSRLRESFRAIRKWQELAAYHFQAEF